MVKELAEALDLWPQPNGDCGAGAPCGLRFSERPGIACARFELSRHIGKV